MNFITVPFTLPSCSLSSKLQTQNVRELVCAVKFCKRIVPSSSFVHSRKCFMKTISVAAAVLCWHKMLEGGGSRRRERGACGMRFSKFSIYTRTQSKSFFLQNLATVDMDGGGDFNDSKLFHFPSCFNVNNLTLIHVIFMNLLGTYKSFHLLFFRYVAWTFYYPPHNHHLFSPIYLKIKSKGDFHTQKHSKEFIRRNFSTWWGQLIIEIFFVSAMCPT